MLQSLLHVKKTLGQRGRLDFIHGSMVGSIAFRYCSNSSLNTCAQCLLQCPRRTLMGRLGKNRSISRQLVAKSMHHSSRYVLGALNRDRNPLLDIHRSTRPSELILTKIRFSRYPWAPTSPATQPRCGLAHRHALRGFYRTFQSLPSRLTCHTDIPTI